MTVPFSKERAYQSRELEEVISALRDLSNSSTDPSTAAYKMASSYDASLKHKNASTVPTFWSVLFSAMRDLGGVQHTSARLVELIIECDRQVRSAGD